MKKLNYLNLGCGDKYHKDWVNVDMNPQSKDIISANLLKGIPFPDNTFDVVYHSQVLEHFPQERALFFMRECFRVLKQGGIIRVVVPDLENIVDEYKKNLNICLETNSNKVSEANYDWIMLELYDQTVRDYCGGQMGEFLRRSDLPNEEYVLSRTGRVGKRNRDYVKISQLDNKNYKRNYKLRKAFSSFKMFKTSVNKVIAKIQTKFFLIFRTKEYQIGSFRLEGEVHLWMYDRYSLSRLLKESGFRNITKKDPFTSDIPEWNKYELDVKDDLVCDPTSLFMEAEKQIIQNNE